MWRRKSRTTRSHRLETTNSVIIIQIKASRHCMKCAVWSPLQRRWSDYSSRFRAAGTPVAFPYLDSTIAFCFTLYCKQTESVAGIPLWTIATTAEFQVSLCTERFPSTRKQNERATSILVPIHDVFVDTHNHFESRSNTQPYSYLEHRARLFITFF